LNPEEDIYRQIVACGDIAHRIEEEIETAELSDGVKSGILLPFAEYINTTTDMLLKKYIDYLREKNNIQLRGEIFSIFDQLLEKIDICRNQVYNAYKN
jgi:hypothetical protein